MYRDHARVLAEARLVLARANEAAKHARIRRTFAEGAWLLVLCALNLSLAWSVVVTPREGLVLLRRGESEFLRWSSSVAVSLDSSACRQARADAEGGATD